MSKKTIQQAPAEPQGMPQTGGSYLADEAAGAVQIEGPAEQAARQRRGFGEPSQAPAGGAAPITSQE